MAHATDIPLGIAQLLPLTQVTVKQKTTRLSPNKYEVFAGANLLMYAKEDASTLGVFFGGQDRAFHIDIFDTQHKEVFHLRRPLTFGPDKMDVTVGGRLACVVRQKPALLKRVLYINDCRDQTVLKVKGSHASNRECDFHISSTDNKMIGVIRKKWGGLKRELFTRADDFEIQFPADLDVSYKCAIIGTCLLIDFLYFEK